MLHPSSYSNVCVVRALLIVIWFVISLCMNSIICRKILKFVSFSTSYVDIRDKLYQSLWLCLIKLRIVFLTLVIDIHLFLLRMIFSIGTNFTTNSLLLCLELLTSRIALQGHCKVKFEGVLFLFSVETILYYSS